MSTFYDLLGTETRGVFDIEYRAYIDDSDPADHLDCTDEEIQELYDKIKNYTITHFGFVVVALVNDLEVGRESVWGCLYENPSDVIRDYGEDLVKEAIIEAKANIKGLIGKVIDG